ncbi:MAG: hypothetical protein D6712_04490 [Chloroflexi bacterium]|nr:MAG: hypothetical protein D6712_04490 [Chloroflexota bacterium]
MSAKIATREAVWAACDALAKTQPKFNRDDVRKQLGGGSYEVLGPLIAAWRALQGVRGDTQNVATELVGALVKQIDDAIGQAQQSVTKRVDEIARAFDEALDAARAELAQQQALLEASRETNNQLSEQLARLTDEMNDMREALALHKNTANEAQTELRVFRSEADKEIQRLRDQLACAEQQIDTLRAEHANEIQSINDAWQKRLDDKERLWRNELAKLVEQAEKREGELMRQLDAERTGRKQDVARMTARENKLVSEHRAALAQMNERLAAMEQELRKAMVGRSDAERRAKNAEIELERLRRENDAMRQTLETKQREWIERLEKIEALVTKQG